MEGSDSHVRPLWFLFLHVLRLSSDSRGISWPFPNQPSSFLQRVLDPQLWVAALPSGVRALQPSQMEHRELGVFCRDLPQMSFHRAERLVWGGAREVSTPQMCTLVHLGSFWV